MAIPANIAVGWPSTSGSIPTGWSRETSLDARYLLGASTGADSDLTTDRGSTTHTHVSPAHTPIQDAHGHIGTAPYGDGDPVTSGGFGTAKTISGATHTHGLIAEDTVALNDAIAIDITATTNDLAYAEVIWIKSDGSPETLPAGSVAFYASDTFPSGWSRVYGDRYLKGAAAAGSGGATGGSNTHTHTSPAHTHTQNAHEHTYSITGGDRQRVGSGAETVSAGSHTHDLEITTGGGVNQSVTTTINTSSSEPPYSKINHLLSASTSLPSGIICLWLGTHAAIPTDWVRYTALDGKWVKGSLADSEVGTTGGSTSHAHTASDCQPIQDEHMHYVYDNGSIGSLDVSAGTRETNVDPHFHTWTLDSTTPTNQAIEVIVNSCSVGAAYPKHRTVIFVQYAGAVPGPTVSLGGYTSYDIGMFDLGAPENRVLPEVAKKIAQGDLRFVPR